MKLLLFAFIILNYNFCNSASEKTPSDIEEILKSQSLKYGTPIIPLPKKSEKTLYSIISRNFSTIINNKEILALYTSGESPFES